MSLAVPESNPDTVPANKKTVLTRFDTGWVRTSKDPDNTQVRFDYTAQGWQQFRIPQLQTPGGPGDFDELQARRWFHAPDGQVIELVAGEPNSDQRNTYRYDANNLLVSATLGRGVAYDTQTRIEVEGTYDGFDWPKKGRLQQQTDTDWRFTTFGFDLNGNLTDREEDGQETTGGGLVSAGRRHTLAYDAADRLTTHTDFGTDSGSADDQRITRSYQPAGWLQERLLEQGTGGGGWQVLQRLTWDSFANGQVKTQTTKNGANTVLESHTVSYEAGGIYVGHRTSDEYTLLGPDAGAPCRTSACMATSTYDPRGRLVVADDGHGGETTYTLNATGGVTKERVVRGGTTTTRDMTYGGTGNQLTAISLNTQPLQRYFYDGRGNVDCVTTPAWTGGPTGLACPPAPALGTDGTPHPAYLADYAYDAFDRLEGFQGYSTDAVTATLTDRTQYVYDALDRPVQQTEAHGVGAPDFAMLVWVLRQS